MNASAVASLKDPDGSALVQDLAIYPDQQTERQAGWSSYTLLRYLFVKLNSKQQQQLASHGQQGPAGAHSCCTLTWPFAGRHQLTAKASYRSEPLLSPR